jgi:hypothetical protein
LIGPRFIRHWLCEVGPPLAYGYPGLPPLHDLSLREIAHYLSWRPPDPDEGDDYDGE